MGYGARHLDGSSDDDVSASALDHLYDELMQADGEHNDVSVIDDDTGWCVTAYPNGRVIFQCLADNTVLHMCGIERFQVIDMWKKLARGALEEVRELPWEKGA